MLAGGFIEQTLGSLFGYRNHAEPFEILQSVKDTLLDDPKTEQLLDNCGLPISHQSEEELEQSWYLSRGEKLADLAEWDQLGREIQEFDKMNATTASGMPISEALTLGARKVVLAPIRDALENGGHQPSLDVFHDVHDAMHAHPRNYGLAALLCLAHVDAGFIWLNYTGKVQKHIAHKTFRRHFAMAQEILNNYNAYDLGSSLLALTQCAILPGLDDPALRFCDDYEDLIELDPTTPQHFLKFGVHLLPAWFGSYATLENYARKLTKTTYDFWGKGAYALVYAGAIAQDVAACERVDPDLFLTSLLDVMERRTDQHAANHYAAFLTLTLADAPHRNDSRASQKKRHKISEAADYVIDEHMREIHPLTWYDTAALINPALQTDHIPTQKLYGGVIAAEIIASRRRYLET